MSWSLEQKNEIFENHWQGLISHCPNDKARLSTQVQKFLGGYMLLASCPRCREVMQMGRNEDPKRDQFRGWTEGEIDQLIDQHFTHGYCSCPVCGSSPHSQDVKFLGGVTHVIIHCDRCGNRFQQQPKN